MDVDDVVAREQRLASLASVGEIVRLTPDEAAAEADKHLDDIRRFAKAPVAPDSVHVYGAVLTRSSINSWWGRFPREELATVASLVPGRPLMVGHDYDRAPIGRFFAAERQFRPLYQRMPREFGYAVRALFYLPRDPEGDAAARRIDLGIWSEVSMGWWFLDAVCSVCGNDVRDFDACKHWPGQVYEAADGQPGLCWFDMENTTAVAEGSVVYMGAVRGTDLFPVPRAAMAAAAVGGRTGAGPVPEFLGPKADVLASAPTVPPGCGAGLDELLAPASRAAESVRSSVQSVLCSKQCFESPEEARRWCSEHDFRSDKLADEGQYYAFRQFEPGRCERGGLGNGETFATITLLQDCVLARICRRKNSAPAGASEAGVEQLLSG